MSLGVYISVPFCRSKCSYCNFASGAFAPARMERYIERVCADIRSCHGIAAKHNAVVPRQVDSIFLGGGTPSLLPPTAWARLFDALHCVFSIDPNPEITAECAPGTLTQPLLEALVSCGVNRISLGVQSFVDREAAAVGRLHTQATVLEDVERLRAAGIGNINIDLIAGLPHQTPASWAVSLDQAIATGVSHVSVYMLEVDEDSRLGRELIAGGSRYHAHFVPDEDLTVELYETARACLKEHGIDQYEISNFARAGVESRHNLKYWTRQPYLGFGVDAHSMLVPSETLQQRSTECIRLATTDSLDEFTVEPRWVATAVNHREALEENFFLGLRLNRGIQIKQLERRFGPRIKEYFPAIEDLVASGLLIRDHESIMLTPRGRLLSNEVFARFIHINGH